MRKLIMWNIITLDGYFEGNKNWGLSFHEAIWGPELEKISIEQLESADFLVFGRVTYEGMAAYWKTEKGEIAHLMNNIPKLIFSRTLKSVDWNNSTLVQGNAADEISKLKTRGNRDMYVFGSADLSETFIINDQFDEYRIGIAPVILGSGRPLFRNKGVDPKKLALISTQQLSNGGAILKYKTEERQT
ncbi:MAG: dihydrofolate reductase family protein [Chitinophagaceae bacterium]